MSGRNWTELVVWQASHELVLELHPFLQTLPADERFALADQIRRAAYSVPANIVEGHSKASLKDFNKFLYIARGSIEEIKYFLLLSRDLNYLSSETYELFNAKASKISSMINNLINSNKKRM
jgi:four helix bundle protein